MASNGFLFKLGLYFAQNVKYPASLISVHFLWPYNKHVNSSMALIISAVIEQDIHDVIHDETSVAEVNHRPIEIVPGWGPTWLLSDSIHNRQSP